MTERVIAGRYRLDALLGRGGMGEVFLALDLKLERFVALKLALLSEAEGVAVARMLHEARVVAALDHPSIVSVFDVGEHEGAPFVVMEYLQGRTLGAYVGSTAPLWQKLGWLVEAARALDAAAQAGVVHRDIKPDNLFVRAKDGALKVLDFGLARRSEFAALSHAATIELYVAGTPAYMSPEQLRGEPLDPRADQFSLGVTAYELLTGALPWGDESSPLALANAVLREEPAPPSAAAPGLPAALDGVVLRALSKAREDRFASLSDFADALAALEVDEEAPAAPARAPEGSDSAATIRLEAPTSLEARPSGYGPRSILDHAEPASASPEARRAYRAALGAFRDGSWADAAKHLDAALEADPQLAPALLRRAIVAHWGSHGAGAASQTRLREWFRRAAASRSRMTARDQALLRALEPLILFEPPDVDESQRRFRAALEAFPEDAELLVLCGAAQLGLPGDGLLECGQRAFAVDPEYLDAAQLTALGLTNRGDYDGARDMIERALELAPTGTDLLWDLALLEAQLGRLPEAERAARRGIALGDDPVACKVLAGVLYARLGRVSAAREWATKALAPGTWKHREAELLCDALEGDFALLARRLEEWSTAPSLREDPDALEARDLRCFELALECGQREFAGAYALEVRERLEVLGRAVRSTGRLDAVCLAAAERAGALSPEAARAERRALWSVPASPAVRWATVYGPALRWRGAEDPALLEEARALLPAEGFGPLYRYFELRADVGHALVVLGLEERAHAELTLAAQTALAPSMPFASTWAQSDLGALCLQRGDLGGARRAFETVLARWGKSTRPSRSVERATRALAAL